MCSLSTHVLRWDMKAKHTLAGKHLISPAGGNGALQHQQHFLRKAASGQPGSGAGPRQAPARRPPAGAAAARAGLPPPADSLHAGSAPCADTSRLTGNAPRLVQPSVESNR